MIIVVDTNIAFSAILNTKSIIGDLILNSNKIFQFWSCHYLLKEINNHWDKLKKISKLNDDDLLESQRLVYNNIHFISEEQIPKTCRLRAFELVKEIDLNDIIFVALNEYEESTLWTGDKALINGLRSTGYDRVITTEEMVKLRNKLD
jgi:predicted nucleic acid-binding protein